jgi:hypothetical protein
MKKLILDYSKWRCGGWEQNKLGLGPTMMRNSEGFECCLGQFSVQLDPKSEAFLNAGSPRGVVNNMKSNGISYDASLLYDSNGTTAFSVEAMGVNDNPYTSPEQKIERLTDMLKKEGYELEVINKP